MRTGDVIYMKKENSIPEAESCLNGSGFPFRTVFTFEYLLEYWRCLEKNHPFRLLYESRIRPLEENHHPLLNSQSALASVEAHPDSVGDLLSIVFPPASADNVLAIAQPVNSLEPFYQTEAYRKTFGGASMAPPPEEVEDIQRRVILYVYSRILNLFYGFEIFYDNSLMVKIVNQETGLLRFFNTLFDDRFIRLVKVSDPPALSDEQRVMISENLNDIELLQRIIPPEHFELRGFIIVQKTDVTTQAVISEIKRELLNKRSILEADRFRELQSLIRTLLCKSDLILALSAIHHDRALVLNTAPDGCVTPECIYRDSRHFHIEDFQGSLFERAAVEGKPLIINDFPEYSRTSPLHPINEQILCKNVKSLLVHPLMMEDRMVGQCVLMSEQTYAFDPLNLMKLEDVYPLFALVIAHALEDFDNEVQSLIQSSFTSIHPSIEWRFRRAAVNFIDHGAEGKVQPMEPIVFDSVYPLYCATDIRGSSTQRNHAIQGDLRDHLLMVREIIAESAAARTLPVLDEYLFRIDSFLADLEDGLVSGDEIGIMQFLHTEVEPAFDDLRAFGEGVAAKIDRYWSAMDSGTGSLYRKRRDFDESVDLLNRTISAYLDRVQPEAQAMFPHYYDKTTTDGVDQNMYIGASLNADGRFDRLYLRNLRLWQLMTLCEIARITDALTDRLPVSLETTHLVVVQDVPLTLVFKTDEKKLAVEGAYNIRYEIMKKRIDKAVVKGTGERLTQIGRIAIVYSQNSEAAEYRQYIEFLTARGFLEGEVEEFVLDDMQGVKGLRALRVSINRKDSGVQREPLLHILRGA